MSSSIEIGQSAQLMFIARTNPRILYCTAEMALVSILCLILAHSWLPFKDEVSWRSEKKAIARGHRQVSGDNFL